MESMEKTNFESEKESPLSSSLATTKVHAFQFETSHVDTSDKWIYMWKWCGLVISIKVVLFGRKLKMLLPSGPLAILLHYFTRKHELVYLFSSVGITHLAELLSYTTEQLAIHTGPTVGSLINATFCNATVLITSIYALNNGYIRVVQQSLLGSILSNLLLVLGCSFFTGGIIHYNEVQIFNKATAGVKSGLIFIATMGIVFPSLLHFTHTEIHYGKSELYLSRFISCVMMVAYACYLYHQLRSQQNLYPSIDEERLNSDEEAPEITLWEAIGWLCISIVSVYMLSGYLVYAIEDTSKSLNIPEAFLTVFLLPIAENARAIKFAMNGRLNNTIEDTVGSSTQILLFIIPFCVLLSWVLKRPMDLNFHLFETAILLMAVLIVTFLLKDGTSHYYKGMTLIFCYLITMISVSLHT